MKENFLYDYKKELTDAIWQVDEEVFREAVRILYQAWREDRQVFIMGNGGSAGTANHFVCDFGKNVEKITALGNDFCFEEIFRFQLGNLMNEGDVLISVSASGNSPDLVRACQYAREKGAKQIVLAGFNGGAIREFADAAFVVPLESYERIEDVHLNILHMLVEYFKKSPELFAE